MNKYTYPQEPLTWGRLEQLIAQMPQEQKEREVLGYGWFSNNRGGGQFDGEYKVVKLRKLLTTTVEDSEICDPGQPILLF